MINLFVRQFEPSPGNQFDEMRSISLVKKKKNIDQYVLSCSEGYKMF